MGHLAGPKGAGLVSTAEMGQFQQFLARYAAKAKPGKLSWPQVLELFAKARAFEKAVSKHLRTKWPNEFGYIVFDQVYLKVDGVVSIVDNLIYNANYFAGGHKWILNETKYGLSNTLSRNQEIIQDAIKAGKKIEIRTAETLVPKVAFQGTFIQIGKIIRSHSTNGTINSNTIKTIWSKPTK